MNSLSGIATRTPYPSKDQNTNAFCGRSQASGRNTEKRQKQNCKPLLQMLVSKGVSGRPRKTSLAEEAASLKRAGKNNRQIASELNKRHGSGTTTHDAVRKLLKRHPDKS